MTTQPPGNQDEYLARFMANQAAEGFGWETAQAMPCPFCAAPRWMVAKIVEFEETAAKPHQCGECGREAKFVFSRTPGQISFELVQTGGEDPPEWLEPKIRRIQ